MCSHTAHSPHWRFFEFLHLFWEKMRPKVLLRGSGPELKLPEMIVVMVTFSCSHTHLSGMLCILQLIQNPDATARAPELSLDFQMSNCTVNGNTTYKFRQLTYPL